MAFSLRDWRQKRKKSKKFWEAFTEMEQVSNEDVFIVGYPKSGNTWFQDLIAAVVYGISPTLAPPALAQQLVPDVHSKAFYQRFATPMFFKSHHLPRPDYRRVVYLLRDGRDVMVSFYHYRKAMRGEADYQEVVQPRHSTAYGAWQSHVDAWLSNPFQAQMIVIRYEDLKENTVAELERFCSFAGIQRARSLLEQAARETCFEKMQEREIRLGTSLPDWPKDKMFRRRGIVGSYKDELPMEILKTFTAQAGGTLKKCGYV